MPIKKVTPEEKAIRDAQDKRVSDYIKEGKTVEEARALVQAAKTQSNNQN
jgi:hypothetical protein